MSADCRQPFHVGLMGDGFGGRVFHAPLMDLGLAVQPPESEWADRPDVLVVEEVEVLLGMIAAPGAASDVASALAQDLPSRALTASLRVVLSGSPAKHHAEVASRQSAARSTPNPYGGNT